MILTQELIVKNNKPAVIKQQYSHNQEPKIKKIDFIKVQSKFPFKLNNGSFINASLKIEVDGKTKFNENLKSISGEHYDTGIILKNKLEIDNFKEIAFYLITPRDINTPAEIAVVFAQEEL